MLATLTAGLELRALAFRVTDRVWKPLLAQVAHEVLGIPLASIHVVHGDTAFTPYRRCTGVRAAW